MCIHKYFIFTQCGHSFFAAEPLIPCALARYPPGTKLPLISHTSKSGRKSIDPIIPKGFTTTCGVPKAHPYRTVLVDKGMCLHCEIERARAMTMVQRNVGIVTVSEGRWRMRYEAPASTEVSKVKGKGRSSRTAARVGNAEEENPWAQGEELDMRGYEERERQEVERRSREASMRSAVSSHVGGVGGLGPNLSPTSWKTSHLNPYRQRGDSFASSTRSGRG